MENNEWNIVFVAVSSVLRGILFNGHEMLFHVTIDDIYKEKCYNSAGTFADEWSATLHIYN